MNNGNNFAFHAKDEVRRFIFKSHFREVGFRLKSSVIYLRHSSEVYIVYMYSLSFRFGDLLYFA